jgi:hypothetical protein
VRVVACSALVRGEGGSLISPWNPSRAGTHRTTAVVGGQAGNSRSGRKAQPPERSRAVSGQASLFLPAAPQAVFCFLPSHPSLPSVFPSSSTSLDNCLDRRLPRPNPPNWPVIRQPSRLVLFAHPLNPSGPIPDLYHSPKLDFPSTSKPSSLHPHVPNTQTPTCKQLPRIQLVNFGSILQAISLRQSLASTIRLFGAVPELELHDGCQECHSCPQRSSTTRNPAPSPPAQEPNHTSVQPTEQNPSPSRNQQTSIAQFGRILFQPRASPNR